MTTQIPRIYARISNKYLLNPLRISLTARNIGTDICFFLLSESPGRALNLSPLFSPWIASITLILFILLNAKKLKSIIRKTVTRLAAAPMRIIILTSGNMICITADFRLKSIVIIVIAMITTATTSMLAVTMIAKSPSLFMKRILDAYPYV